MKKMTVRLMCAATLVLLGWLTGRAQGLAEPQFVLELEAPHGWTKVVCARGCELIGSRAAQSPDGRALQYYYGCGVSGSQFEPPTNPSPDLRCKATVYGWLRQ
jgi:hypothetical protein